MIPECLHKLPTADNNIFIATWRANAASPKANLQTKISAEVKLPSYISSEYTSHSYLSKSRLMISSGLQRWLDVSVLEEYLSR